MNTKFLNLSNHPSAAWGAEQLEAAQKLGSVVDLPFPVVAPTATSADVAALVSDYFEKVKSVGSPTDVTVHLMGESTFVHKLVSKLKDAGYQVVASTTERLAVVDGDKKVSVFKFCQFRAY